MNYKICKITLCVARERGKLASVSILANLSESFLWIIQLIDAIDINLWHVYDMYLNEEFLKLSRLS